MSRFTRSIVCFITVVIIAIGAVRNSAAADEQRPTSVVRSYNISELVQTVPDYPLETTPQQGAGMEQAAQKPPSTRPSFGGQAWWTVPRDDPRVEALIRVIEDFVAPDTWKEQGGEVGSIGVIGSSLIISQTEANHRSIQDLLDNIRRDSAVDALIQIDAYWLLLTPEQFEALTPIAAHSSPWPVLEDPQALYCRARTIGFNGQTLSVSSGRESQVVDHAVPVVAPGAGFYDLQTKRDRAGVALQVTPRLAPNRQTITVDVHSTVTDGPAVTSPLIAAALSSQQLNFSGIAKIATGNTALPTGNFVPPTSQPSGAQPQDFATALWLASAAGANRPERIEQKFRTTVRLSADKPVVIGGMTLEPGKSGGKQLYLVLSAHPLEGASSDHAPAK